MDTTQDQQDAQEGTTPTGPEIPEGTGSTAAEQVAETASPPDSTALAAPAQVPPVFPAPEYPPPAAPTYSSVPTYAPPVPHPAPSSTGKTIAIAIGIVAACLVVLGGLGVAIFFVAQSAIRSIEEQGIPDLRPEDGAEEFPELLPLVAGDPSEPLAVAPVDCPTTCFSGIVVGDAISSDEVYEQLGFPKVVNAFGSYPETTPQAEFSYAYTAWTENDGTPDECFFTLYGTPVSLPLDSVPAVSTDTIHYLEYRSSKDDFSGLDQSVRLFSDSASASAHLQAVHAGAAACTHYEIGKGREFWEADVTPLAALSLPDSVAAAGWVESSEWSRFYVVDLQRGNLVLRTSMSTDGAITEEAYRDYVEGLAVQLASLTP